MLLLLAPGVGMGGSGSITLATPIKVLTVTGVRGNVLTITGSRDNTKTVTGSANG